MTQVELGLAVVHISRQDLAGLQPRPDRVAIVSSDDNWLSHGGGVSRALWAAGGRRVAEVVRPPGLGVGDVLVGPAGDLPAQVLMHAVTLDLDRRAQVRDLSALYGAVLDEATARGPGSIALPLLASGAAGHTVSSSASALARALAERWTNYGTLTGVELVVLDAHVLRETVDALQARSLPMRTPAGLAQAVAAVEAPSAATAATAIARLGMRQAAADPGAAFLSLLHVVVELGLASLSSADASLRKLGPAAEELVRRHGIVAGKPVDAGLPAEDLLAIALSVDAATRTTWGHPEREDLRRAHDALRRTRVQLQTGSIDRDLELVLALAVRSLAAWALGERPGGRTTWEVARDASSAMATRAGTWTAPIASVVAMGVARLTERAADRIHPEARPREPDRLTTTSTHARPEPRGTEAVRALHAFLLEHLPESAQQSLDTLLTHQGYRGPWAQKLLEYCVAVPDPAQFVAAELSRSQLLEALRERGVERPRDEDGVGLAQHLLHRLGFPRPRPLVGLSTVRTELERSKRRVSFASTNELRGLVAEAGSRLEYVLLVVLQVTCREAVNVPAEVWLREEGILEANRALSKQTLGTLVHLLLELVKAAESGRLVNRNGDPADLRSRDAYVGMTRRLPELRNRFVHLKSEELTLEALRAEAVLFFDQALALVDLLGADDPRVFPHVVRIERVAYDEWGRRTVEGCDDDGRLERIFTDEPLRPGERYFMKTTSNPMRVDPFLLEVGELDA